MSFAEWWKSVDLEWKVYHFIASAEWSRVCFCLCLFVCLCLFLFTKLLKSLWTYFDEIFWQGGHLIHCALFTYCHLSDVERTWSVSKARAALVILTSALCWYIISAFSLLLVLTKRDGQAELSYLNSWLHTKIVYLLLTCNTNQSWHIAFCWSK